MGSLHLDFIPPISTLRGAWIKGPSVTWRLSLLLNTAMGAQHKENLCKGSLFLIFQILTEFKWALHLTHVISFLVFYLEKVSLKYLFWFFVLNNLYSSFPPEIQTQSTLFSLEDSVDNQNPEVFTIRRTKAVKSAKWERGPGFLVRLLKTLSLVCFLTLN